MVLDSYGKKNNKALLRVFGFCDANHSHFHIVAQAKRAKFPSFVQ